MPYFAVTWQSFLDLKDISKVVSLKDHVPEDQLFLVEPYSQDFMMKLLAEC
jgi:hypothetical protein